MSPSRQGSRLRIIEFLYLVLAALSFYQLVESRTGEAQTVWQTFPPFFVPTLFTTTFVLFAILFTSDKTAHNLLFIIIHSVIIHSFFSIIFPAGDLSGQQMVLGRTRRVFDNTILYGWTGLPTQTLQVAVYEMLQGLNLQAALSTIFARMLTIDIFYVHLFLVPVLWGVFIPLGIFLIAREIGFNENASVLSGALVSAFPYATYFGAISVPNSLGFIFFLYSLLFMLKHLSSRESGTTYWILIFTGFSFLAHFLTGFLSISLLILTLAFKEYANQKVPSTAIARIFIIVTFLVCTSLLPISFAYLRFLGSGNYVAFTLSKIHELPVEKIVGLFLVGELAYGFDTRTIILVVIGPFVAFLSMSYSLFKAKNGPDKLFRIRILLLFVAFLVVFIDYRILKLFMEGLPINEERLWVFRDLIAAPFVATAVYSMISRVTTTFRTISLGIMHHAPMKLFPRNKVSRIGLFLVFNILTSALLSGWITCSLSAAYTQNAPLQTTYYELEAVRYIDEQTKEKYVVIGDIWTIYAGEVIVGIQNPRAYYFTEHDPKGHDLFRKMMSEPSPQTMREAMSQTGIDTTAAYFIVTEPRVGTEEFHNVVSRALETQLRLFYLSDNGGLYVFSYRKE